MTVHSIDTSFQYATPDIKKIKTIREDLNYKFSTLSNLYLPLLSEELRDLQKEVNATDSQALKTMTLVPAALQTSEINTLITVITNLSNEKPTAEQQEAITSFYKEIQILIKEALGSSHELSTQLRNSLTNLEAASLSDNRHRLSELEKTIDNISPQLLAIEGSVEQLVNDETSLNQAIKIIESADAFTLIRELFLNVEKLTALNLSAPQLELVKAGISAGTRILGLVENAVKYDNLISARRQVQTQLDDQRSKLANIKKEVKTLQDRKGQLTELQAVTTLKEGFSTQIHTLAESLNQFLDNNRHDASDDAGSVVKCFIEQSKVYSAHLIKLRGEWRR